MSAPLLGLMLPGPPAADTMTAWEYADERIAYYQETLQAAERGEGRGDVTLCREKIDEWLLYRFAHGPADLRAAL